MNKPFHRIEIIEKQIAHDELVDVEYIKEYILFGVCYHRSHKKRDQVDMDSKSKIGFSS